MTLTKLTAANQDAMNSAVLQVAQDFSSQIEHIRTSFGEDSTDAPAMFFRILVRDEFAPVDLLLPLAQRLTITLMNQVGTDEYGLRAYFDFRSVSEQRKLQDLDWD